MSSEVKKGIVICIMMLMLTISFSGCTETDIEQPKQENIPELGTILKELKRRSNERHCNIGQSAYTTTNILQLLVQLILWFFESYMGISIN
jgi:hypothetical protein